ncbi:helix-turn-helix domain-containing protein [Marinilongibacter aquaticus]|uniref:helix-turn-helix domain-containing protein n=1 Tax=Marinilongibacter aquaticus TaxID=2975157 RepID=UPI0021BD2473|nr:helix-turn-helix transcriptional regulator [Marinilongibacter aquaticus]UBM59953.1 helix-turn-helix domain-containing protein [Marinilongibacter aquaticus]
MAEIFARNLVHLRNRLGLTQEKLAVELGFTRASIDAYEGDRATPPYAKLKTFARVLGKSVQELTDEKLWESDLQEADMNEDLALPDLPLFAELNPENMANSEAWLNQIAIVAQSRLQDFVAGEFDPYADEAARISMPIYDKGQYLAFESGTDFPLPKSFLIGLKVEKTEAIEDGEICLLIDKKGQAYYRKVYNQSRERGVFVLTPMVSGLASQDLAVHEIHGIWQVKAFLSYTMPQFKTDKSRAQALVQELQEEIRRLS